MDEVLLIQLEDIHENLCRLRSVSKTGELMSSLKVSVVVAG